MYNVTIQMAVANLSKRSQPKKLRTDDTAKVNEVRRSQDSAPLSSG